jgi:hypothetical protein
MKAASTQARTAFAKLFRADECAIAGCQRQPRPGSRFCPPHFEDRKEHRVVVFNGTQELSGVGERHGDTLIQEAFDHPAMRRVQ